MERQKIQVVIVDDHPLMREALRNAIETEADMEVSAEAANGRVAIEYAGRLCPDVIVMDLFMPVMDGLEAIRQIKQAHPQQHILALTSSNEDEKVLEAVRAGANGYILKDSPRSQVLQGIREIARGRRFLSQEVAEKMANALQGAAPSPALLTQRETQALELLGMGFTNREIAEKMVISESTVRVHIYNLMEKLKLANRRQAVQYAARMPRPRTGF